MTYYYRINLYEPGRLYVDFKCLGNGLNWSLNDYYLDRQFFGETIWGGSESEPQSGTGQSFYMEAGVYYVKVVSWQYNGGTGKFWLKASFTPAENTEDEPNNIPEKANILGIGDEVRGFISEQDHDDYYKVSLNSRTIIRIMLTSYMEGIWIRLLNSDFEEIGLKGDTVIWGGSLVEPKVMSYVIDLQPGDYYIHMAPWKYSGKNGVYSIKITEE